MRFPGLTPFLIATVAASSCVAPDRPDSGPRFTGSGGTQADVEAEPPCFCEILERRSLSIEVSFECLCERFGCPTTIAGLGGPTSNTVSKIECGDRITLAWSASLAGAVVHTFSKTTGELLGSEHMADYPAYCEAVSVSAGEVMLRDNECGADWCILSHGLDRIAPPGECLDPSVLDEPEWGGSSGGAGGAGGMGGGP